VPRNKGHSKPREDKNKETDEFKGVEMTDTVKTLLRGKTPDSPAVRGTTIIWTELEGDGVGKNATVLGPARGHERTSIFSTKKR